MCELLPKHLSKHTGKSGTSWGLRLAAKLELNLPAGDNTTVNFTVAASAEWWIGERLTLTASLEDASFHPFGLDFINIPRFGVEVTIEGGVVNQMVLAGTAQFSCQSEEAQTDVAEISVRVSIERNVSAANSDWKLKLQPEQLPEASEFARIGPCFLATQAGMDKSTRTVLDKAFKQLKAG